MSRVTEIRYVGYGVEDFDTEIDALTTRLAAGPTVACPPAPEPDAGGFSIAVWPGPPFVSRPVPVAAGPKNGYNTCVFELPAG